MTFDYAFFLAFIQGATEFLPISSSAHLILPSALFGLPDQGLSFDVAVHVGSLGAVILALRTECRRIVIAMTTNLGRRYRIHARLGWMITIATLPAVTVGLFMNEIVATTLRLEEIIAATTILFSLVLWWAHYQKGARGLSSIGIKEALILGIAQSLALIPGTSRSGITLSAGLLLGLSRRVAAQFSFMMAIPVIMGAGLIKTIELIFSSSSMAWNIFAFAMIVSFVTAFFCIRLFLRWINRLGLLPFVWYRLFLGILIIIWML